MKIAIIGAGRVGGALASGWRRAGHTVILGARDPASENIAALVADGFRAVSLDQAAADAEVVLLATPPAAALELTEGMELGGKIVIDATNSIAKKPAPYRTVAEGLKSSGRATDVVKCFNSTGFENMADPLYAGRGVDMFMAGSSLSGKDVARRLALDLGFEECYDFGGDDLFEALEQFAFAWINLALKQGQGRNIAFKLLKR